MNADQKKTSLRSRLDQSVLIRVHPWRTSAVLCVLCSLCVPARAQDGPRQPAHPVRVITVEEAEKEKARLEKAAEAAFARDDFAAAEASLRELVPLDHENFVPWYNLACALSMLGQADEAAQMLRQSALRGFADMAQAGTDPHLANARATPGYRSLIADWDRIVAAQGDRRIGALKARYHVGERGSPYTFELDEPHGLAFISAFDPVLFVKTKEEIERLNRWWEAEVVPPAAVRPARPQPPVPPPFRSALPPPLPDPPAIPLVTVLLPTRPDYRAWAQQRFGDLWDRIGGSYSNDEKALVAMDLGASMRHEYWHVLHWRDMGARHQRHPIWVMEGLCSLVEDVDAAADGSMIPKPSWRTNMARRLARAGHLTPWIELFALDQKRFIRTRPLALYGQSRAIFLYLHQRGRLRDWYAAYVQTYAEDPTGLAAFARAFDQPAKAVEKDYRAWCAALPEVPEEVGRMAANLPVEVEPGNGGGVVVANSPSLEAFLAPGNKAPSRDNTGGLRLKDVITAVDGKSVRDLNDLIAALTPHEAGETVEIAYTRRNQHGTARVTLVPPR